MITKDFLESFPLYKRLDIEQENRSCAILYIPKPAINMHCKVCGSNQTYNMINDFYELENERGHIVWGKKLRAIYQCSSCNKDRFYFYLEFVKVKDKTKSGDSYSIGFVRKVGQTPPWEIKIDKNIEILLGEHADYFNKGLINESQSYGIGAFAYYRRITEEIIDGLLTQIEKIIPPEDKEKYQEALKETKKTKVTEEKINLVKDLLPNTLTPDGINPLAVLHSTLSEGLHSESDEKCLEYADKIKKSLLFLVNRVLKIINEDQEFTESLKGLLDEKSKKIAERKAKI